MSEQQNFSDIGKVEAIASLFAGTPYKPFDKNVFEVQGRGVIASYSRMFLEGIDFNLVYFPLKHLGYKCATAVTGELYSRMAHPVCLTVVLGVSSKLDFAHVREIWDGIVSAAKEHGYKKVFLDLVPSPNGLFINLSAIGEEAILTEKRRPSAKSKDLICVSGPLGAAYLGMQLLERERTLFDEGETDHVSRERTLSKYKMLVAAYLKPELQSDAVSLLEKLEIVPSSGVFVSAGLSDAVKRMARETGLGAKIYADKIPFEGNSFQLGKELDIDPVSAAMNGGDDFRLLFTIPILSLEKFKREFQSFEIIGHLAQPEVGSVLVTPDGVELPMKAQGWAEE